MQQDWRDALGALSAALGGMPDAADSASHGDAGVAQSQYADLQTAPLHIVLERKGRAGKTATIICGFTVSDDRLADIASRLKRRIGCGGSARGGEILLQGDRLQLARSYLIDLGFKVK